MAPVTQRPVLRVSLVVVGTFFPGVGGNVGGSQDQPPNKNLIESGGSCEGIGGKGENYFLEV